MKQHLLKRILSLCMILLLLFSTASCARSIKYEKGTAERPYRIGVAIYDFSDDFMTKYRMALKQCFSAPIDGKYYKLVFVDGKNDMSEQSNQIDSLIAQGMDAIILNLVQTSSADAIIDRVVPFDIPLILINTEPLGTEGDDSYEGILQNEKVCYVGADARQSGAFQGEIIYDLPDHGDIDGDGIVSYVMIEGGQENIDALYRTTYSVKYLEDHGVRVKCLLDQIGDWQLSKGQEICANALSQYGKKVEVVFCNNDAMAIGASAAIEAAGRRVGKDIYLVGVDANPECVEMVKNGEMTGTVLNDLEGQAGCAARVAADAIEGKKIGNYYRVDYVKVDQ